MNVPLLKTLGLLPLMESEVDMRNAENSILKIYSVQTSTEIVESGNNIDPNKQKGPERIATYYSDGGVGYNSGTGDGRALLFSHISVDGQSFDIGAKGIGPTGLGYKNYAGHTDGFDSLADSIQEYFIGELFYRSGISNSSRVLAVIKTQNQRTLSNGWKVPAAIVFRVMPTFLRMAHLWKIKDEREKNIELLNYLFKSDARFSKPKSFSENVSILMKMNIETPARELALLDALSIFHGSPTRGNRLLTGELIDFGTVWPMGLNYREARGNKYLGRAREQKKFALHWTQKVYRILREIDPTLSFDVEKEFEEKYKEFYSRAQLMKLGLPELWVEKARTHSPELFFGLAEVLSSLESLETREKMGKKMEMPILDMNLFFRDFNWNNITKNRPVVTQDFMDFLERFGTKF